MHLIVSFPGMYDDVTHDIDDRSSLVDHSAREEIRHSGIHFLPFFRRIAKMNETTNIGRSGLRMYPRAMKGTS